MTDKSIYIEDDYNLIALKIYKLFNIGDVCTVSGYVMVDSVDETLLAKGQMVCEKIYEMDKREHVSNNVRKSVKLAMSIGGTVAHKIFRYKIEIKDQEPIYTIWRIQ